VDASSASAVAPLAARADARGQNGRNSAGARLLSERVRSRAHHPLAALAVAAVAAVALLGAPQPGDARPRGSASVKVAECARGELPTDRRAAFRGVMRRVAGTHRMWMRFTLQERRAGERFVALRAPGLGIWRRSRDGVGGFAYRQRVLELAIGSTYRAKVDFRWYADDGRVLERATRRTRGCSQPGPLPNLDIGRIGAQRLDGAPGATRYAVRVRNRGVEPARASTLAFSVDGSAVDTVAVPELAPAQVRRVFVTGPRCDARLRAEVDPDGVVNEAVERDNVRSIRCPPLR